ncbi:MAG: glycosyltransferase family 2 protein [Roseburia sp.]|nr:glycosyltransferase family 2 protein [Roseburia sp.]
MVTASVVLFNTQKQHIDTLLKCIIPSCVEKLYIIDNSFNDRWREIENLSEKLRYIHNKNIGYGASHNLAIHLAVESGSNFHLIMNPDIRFEPGVLEELRNVMNENEDVVYILPKVVDINGEVQYLCKLLPTPEDLIFRRFIPAKGLLKKWKEKKNARYCLMDSGYDKVINPPCLSGCFMFMRLSAITNNDIFFDEDFFMYFEDFDLIRRLHRIGKTIYYPEVVIIHDHARESYKNYKMLKVHIKSAIHYFNKYGWVFDKERRKMNEQILKEL